MSDIQRDIGALEARADAQEERLARIALGSIAATLAGLLGAWISKVLHLWSQS